MSRPGYGLVEVYMDILRAVSEGRDNLSNICAAVNLNWVRANPIVRALVHKGLLTIRTDSSKSRPVFLVSDRGYTLLDTYKHLKMILDA